MSLTTQLAFAYSGRTDSNEGHRDNKNVSGLGSYHYHCGGYPAYLHNNGVCHYKGTSSYNEGYNKGTIYLEEENKKAYEDGYNEMEYSVPENFSIAEAMLMESFNQGSEAIKLEKEKKTKAVTGTLLLAASAVGGFTLIKNKKSKKEEVLI